MLKSRSFVNCESDSHSTAFYPIVSIQFFQDMQMKTCEQKKLFLFLVSSPVNYQSHAYTNRNNAKGLRNMQLWKSNFRLALWF